MPRTFTPEHIEKKRIAATGKKYPNRRKKTPEELAIWREKFFKSTNYLNYKNKPRPKKVPDKEGQFSVRSNAKMPAPTQQVVLCSEGCGRYCLPQLGCLFCTVYVKNKV